MKVVRSALGLQFLDNFRWLSTTGCTVHKHQLLNTGVQVGTQTSMYSTINIQN